MVKHKVSLYFFLKHWAKKTHNYFFSYFVKPHFSDKLFVFVVGCGHSGTTLMAAKLSNHSSVLTIGRETEILAAKNSSLPEIKAVAVEWEYFSDLKGATCVVEKTPKHVYSYNTVQKILPNNKFIVMVRNPLDTIASIYKRFGDLDFSIERWVYDNKEALKINNSKNVLFVKYEDFTRNPKKELINIAGFLNLKYEPSMLEVNNSIYGQIEQKNNMKLRLKQVSEPIRINEGGWKMVFDKDQATEILNRVNEIACLLGYKREEL